MHFFLSKTTYGVVVLPRDFAIPAEIDLGQFQNAKNGVSGSVVIINHKKLRIENFSYDGTEPGQSDSNIYFSLFPSHSFCFFTLAFQMRYFTLGTALMLAPVESLSPTNLAGTVRLLLKCTATLL